MKARLLFTLLVFAVGVGTGFYIWGYDEREYMFQHMTKVTEPRESAPTQKQKVDATTRPLTAADITAGLVGAWQSVDDLKFTREFSVDASVTDRYDGDEAATMEGRWAVFTAPEGEPPPFPIPKGTVYLKISNVEEVLYFKVVSLERGVLELSYLDGVGVQKYQRKN